VVFLGRIGDRKGALRLLEAWGQLDLDASSGVGSQKVATLTMAGDGEVELARRRIRELRLEDTVELHEWLSESDVDKLLDRSHVLVLPSRNEGQPMAVLEAMARGMCVVASDVGGLQEMIGGGRGVIVPPDDIDAIADASRLVIEDRDLRARYGAAAYARVEAHFEAGAVARRIDALYREVSR
jgi:glycosyltransferase involved in cell wall biosynthesis